MELAEQAGVLNRLHRLRRESLEQIDRGLRKCSRLFTAHDQKADNSVLPQQRRDKDCPIAGIQNQVPRQARWLIAKIRNLNWSLSCERRVHVPIACIEVIGKCRNGGGIHTVSRALFEFLAPRIKNVDRSGYGARELDGL